MPKPSRSPGLRLGFRSGLEEKVAAELDSLNIPFKYETEKVCYLKPARQSTYTPDYLLPNGIVIETKGRFLVADRQKHLIIKAQHPELDIRFVFSSSKGKISKNSKTTYADWCEKHDFKFADKSIPQAWLDEPREQGRFDALEKARVKSNAS